ncbi:MAG TPA: hypothetical protein VIF34_06920 [Methylocystis sp.]|jgi:hypothetical protein
MVKRLVLAVTSGGVPIADLGASDWRPDYSAAYPRAAKWIADPVDDLSSQIRRFREGIVARGAWSRLDQLTGAARSVNVW